MDFNDGTIFIALNREIFDNYNLLNTLYAKIPAHLRLKVDIHIQRKFTQQIGISSDGLVSAFIVTQPVVNDVSAKSDVRISKGSYI